MRKELTASHNAAQNVLLQFCVPVSQTLSAGKWDSAFFSLSDVEVMGQMLGQIRTMAS